MKVVRVIDEQRHGLLGAPEQLLQVALTPFRLARYLDRLLGGQIVEQRGLQQRQADLCLIDRQRARHGDPPLALEIGSQPARQDGFARADDRGQRNQPAAHDRRPDIARYLGMVFGLEEAGIDRWTRQAVKPHHLGQHRLIPPRRPCGKRSCTAARISGRARLRSSNASMKALSSSDKVASGTLMASAIARRAAIGLAKTSSWNGSGSWNGRTGIAAASASRRISLMTTAFSPDSAARGSESLPARAATWSARTSSRDLRCLR